MKNIKVILLIVTVFLMISCNPSEDNEPTIHTVSGTIDTTALVNLASNDATSLVRLNGQPAETYTTEAAKNDEIFYNLTTAASNTEIVIIDFFFTSGNGDLWESGLERIIDTQSSTTIASIKVLSEKVGDEVKFGFTFALKTNGVLDSSKTYIVDPKIRIRP